MQFTRAIAIALIASIVGIQAVDAKSLRKDGDPAELPPASFQGNQYVDSRGCVFVRAGVNGGTNWVPRVTRDRKLVCGFQPTLNAEQRKSASQPERVVKITPEAAPVAEPAPMAKPVIVAAQPAPKRAVQVRQTAAPKRYATPVVAQPRTIAVKPYQPKADVAPKVVTSTRTKPLPQRVVNRKPRRGDVVVEGQVADNVRVIPRHVYENRGNTIVKPPKGYKTVWKDDRLNPLRADQTFAGKAKMDAIWTQTVPRRLIKVPARETVTK